MAGDLIGREALDRIVRRAAELQASERDIGDGLSEPDLLALGKDVGIPERFLRQAMLEERTRTAPQATGGTWAWIVGPRSVAAHRVVPGERAAVERALSRWMEEEELLQSKRRYPDRATWEPKAGAFASIQRALAGGRRYTLARAAEVTGQVVQIEPGFCLVRLEADVHQQRTARLTGAAVMATAGWAVSGVLTMLALPIDSVVLLPGAALTIGAVLVARSHRGPNERALVALEQVLDRLERGEIRAERALPPQHPLERIADQVRKAFGAP